MSSSWSPSNQIALVDALVRRTSADLEQFFAAHDLGAAYNRAGKNAGKKAKINSALGAVESASSRRAILDAAAARFGFDVSEVDEFAKGVRVASQGKIFLSHASGDRELAAALKDTLVLGGVAATNIFLSSERATGIPAGKNVTQYLQEVLSGASLVIELITANFLLRPFCLIELGGAWALGKPTFPIVVVPLTYADVAQEIGDFQSALLAGSDEVDTLFDELSECISESVPAVTIRPTQWGSAVRQFKSRFPGLITAKVRPELGDSTDVSDSGDPASKLTVESRGIEGRTFSVRNSRYSTEVHGLVRNTLQQPKSVIMTATFYGADGSILGTAQGLVDHVDPGEEKTITLSSMERYEDFSKFSVQVDTVF